MVRNGKTLCMWEPIICRYVELLNSRHVNMANITDFTYLQVIVGALSSSDCNWQIDVHWYKLDGLRYLDIVIMELMFRGSVEGYHQPRHTY